MADKKPQAGRPGQRPAKPRSKEQAVQNAVLSDLEKAAQMLREILGKNK